MKTKKKPNRTYQRHTVLKQKDYYEAVSRYNIILWCIIFDAYYYIVLYLIFFFFYTLLRMRIYTLSAQNIKWQPQGSLFSSSTGRYQLASIPKFVSEHDPQVVMLFFLNRSGRRSLERARIAAKYIIFENRVQVRNISLVCRNKLDK